MNDWFEELREQCVAKIAGSTPYGIDPRSTEEFRAVKSLIARYGDYRTKSTEGDVDEPKQWAAVIEHCRVILTQQGKDLRVLCWLCGALVSIRGIQGLQTGLTIMRYFLENNPEALHPSDVRVKANAFSWLTEFIDFAVATYSKYVSNNLQVLTGDETRTLLELSQEFERFYDAANESLADDRFDFKPLKNLRENLQSVIKLAESRMSVVDEDETPVQKQEPPKEKSLEEKPKPEPTNQPAPKVVTTPQASEPEPPARKSAPAPSSAQPDDSKADKSTLLRDLAAWSFKLRTIAPHDPLAFRALRLARWNMVTSQPPTLPKTRRTRLPGPRAEFTILKAREAKLAKREPFDHVAFLETCELWFNKYPYWLDLQYLAHASADFAGLSDLKTVIVVEIRTLLEQVGGEFMELEFKEGTPFADETTRQWLRTIMEAQPLTMDQFPAKIDRPVPAAPPASPSERVLPVQPSTALVLTTDKPSAPLEVFIHDRFQELAAGKALEAITTAATKIAAEDSALARWRLLRVCGLAAAALPAHKLLALALLKESRALAESLTIKSLQPAEFSEVVLTLRDLGTEETLSQPEQNWISNTTEALRVAPAAVILREIAREEPLMRVSNHGEI